MYGIGLVARLAQVSVRTLRHYDDVGLLKPSHVDPITGYRHYTPDQDPVQPEDLLGGVVPVPRDRVDVTRLEQANVVVMPQRAYRDLRQARHQTYPVHGSYSIS